MNSYKVYKISTTLMGLFTKYPNCKKKILSLKAENPFFTAQIETLLEDNYAINEHLFSNFSGRSDYQYENNVHILHNEITKEIMTCEVKPYEILIKARKKSNIFFDILYQYSKRYVIMDEEYS